MEITVAVTVLMAVTALTAVTVHMAIKEKTRNRGANKLLQIMRTDKWDIEVDANKSGVSLQLNQLWRYRDLLVLFIKRDFSAQYKQTVLGPLWFLLQPVLTAVAYSIVFGLVAGISTGGYPRVIFYLSGVTCWMYFADCVNKTGSTFVTNSNLFSKVYDIV